MLRARAPAKVNLTLHVLGRRADGFHELDSLVAFAGCAADALAFRPSEGLALSVEGPFACAAGAGDDNLVLKAAREAAARIPGLRLGRFSLVKRIPVAAGLGGGSADAAAALRLLAQANGIAAEDPRLVEAAAATGSDVPACLVSRAARMTGRGEGVAPLAGFAPLAAVLANPLKPVSTPEIFRRLALKPGETRSETTAAPDAGLAALVAARNDLEAPARSLLADIGTGLEALAQTEGCRLARMSGSGATVFGLYDDQRSARRAARALRAALPGWWVMPTMLR
ncbi:4-(cytidine 5'-diphospho)-2-C-methyl-D-erythritol kinase [Chenggangzhangella methanolivorans]|uniref:4-(cytidine 5'-diphospho)-2-C-methyl-D-erythritol kinase n=1 Tax=Chenggangzhangella methanolivorans TaxID=1437009 RepID=UPI00360F8F3E